TVTYASIQPNNGRSRQAIFYVPAGKIAFIDELIISGNSTGGPSDYLEGYFRATCDYTGAVLDGIFNFKAGLITSNSASTQTLANPIIVPALC
ncbi:hypothetical protein U2087_15530, partial [Listeria monocytogenes]|uniref:hypothetical protein n=1 Tax=Listeria monocytogenes TaxID=1639 RepID=UPI002FDBCE43